MQVHVKDISFKKIYIKGYLTSKFKLTVLYKQTSLPVYLQGVNLSWVS